MATYPAGIPSLNDPISTDYLTSPAHAELHVSVNDEIEALATELGTNPRGGYPDVTARLDAVDASLAGKVGSVAGANGYLLMYQGGVIVDSGYQASDFLGSVAGVASNFASLDGAGDLQDSGYSASSFTAAAHPASGDHDTRYYQQSEVDTLLSAKEDAGTAAAAITAHLAVHTSSVEHNPFIVGSKQIDESNIADNKVLYFHFESNQIRYGDMDAVSQEQVQDWVAALIQDGVGPLTWTYDDVAGTLTGDLPQGIDTTDTPQFVSVNINGNYSLPSVDGSNGYVMTTNGSGVVTWQAASAAADVQNSPIRHFDYALGGM